MILVLVEILGSLFRLAQAAAPPSPLRPALRMVREQGARTPRLRACSPNAETHPPRHEPPARAHAER